tara:strand:- start:14646 stop:15452 length:807 start_codon:yes stop_codon:yes gene_type:complete
MQTSGSLRPPQFLIIGAQKCGSSWLFFQLNQSPQISMNPLKETHFFIKYEDPTDEEFEDYLRSFEGPPDSMLGEATPSYLVSPPTEATEKYLPYLGQFFFTPAKSIKKRLGPNVKLIVTVKDPVERAASAFFHHVNQGRIEPGKTLTDLGNFGGILYLGFYGQHLSYWLQHFPIENFLFTSLSEIKEDPASVLERIGEFLEIPSYQAPPTLQHGKYTNPMKKVKTDEGIVIEGMENSPRITKEELTFLRDLYAEDSARFNELVGRKLL